MNNSKYSHRYGSARIQILNSEKKPLSNASVHISLKNHEFLFGCGAFDAIPMLSNIPDHNIAFYQDKLNPDKSFYKERMEKWLALFNYSTLPFYWNGYEPKEGQVMFESRMKAAEFLKAHGVRVKGHPLCWHTECAKWLLDYDNKTILDKQLDRIHREINAFKGVIDMWDVINETVILPVYDRYDNAITRICNAYGRINLIKEVFVAAHAANPNAVLLINDFNLSEDYYKIIDECLMAGVPIKAIGIESHQHQGFKGMEWLEEVLERFSAFGLPLHFTENTLLSGDVMPAHIVDLNDYIVDKWPTTPEGEERQAEEWKQMYTRLFAHPLVEAITGWDFADGGWLHAPSGFVREDNSEKLSYYTLKQLIKEEWNTASEFMTDENGYIDFYGVRGTFDVTYAQKKAEFILDKTTTVLSILLK